MSPSEPLRVGILGLGIGRAHLEAFRAVPGCEVTAVGSRTKEKVQAFAAEHDVPHAFWDADALMTSGIVDLVVVATPNGEHLHQTSFALSNGLHVLCEKPMAVDTASARQMVVEARRLERRLGVHMNRRMQPAIHAMRRAHDAGRFGEVDLVRATWHRQRGIPAREGFLTKERAGGGALIDLGVHMLDQALFVLGFPEVRWVSCHTRRRFFDRDVPEPYSDVEDMALAQLHLATGTLVEVEISWASTHHLPEERVLQVYGTQGGARRVNHGEGEEDVFFAEYGRDGAAEHAPEPPPPVPTVQADMVAAVSEDRPPCCDAEQGVAIMQLLDALYESAAQEGRPVEL